MSEIIHKIEYTTDEAKSVSDMEIDVNWEELINLFNLGKIEISINYPQKISFNVVKKQVGDFREDILKQPEILMLKSDVCVDKGEENVNVLLLNKRAGVDVHIFPQKEKSMKTGAVFMGIFAKTLYLMKYGEELFEAEEKTVKVNSNKKKGKNKNKKSVFKTKHYKCYKIINCEEIKRKLSKKHKITCNLWEVGGHLRRYKNGKVVYIRPYKKGKDRDKDIVVVKQHDVIPKDFEIGGVTNE